MRWQWLVKLCRSQVENLFLSQCAYRTHVLTLQWILNLNSVSQSSRKYHSHNTALGWYINIKELRTRLRTQSRWHMGVLKSFTWQECLSDILSSDAVSHLISLCSTLLCWWEFQEGIVFSSKLFINLFSHTSLPTVGSVPSSFLVQFCRG